MTLRLPHATLAALALAGCGAAPGVAPAHPAPAGHAETAAPPPASTVVARAPAIAVAAPEPVTEDAPSVPAPRWTELYARYFGPGTSGGCGRAAACHAKEMGDATSMYEWLKTRGYLAGPQSAFASARNSPLRWFGGSMPPRGTNDDQGARDVAAWVAAGASAD